MAEPPDPQNPHANHATQDEIACFAPLFPTNYTVFALEVTMPRVNLSGMNVQALMSLQDEVNKRLLELRSEIEKQLAAFSGPKGKPNGSSLKGKKVPPKYRSPSGETWAGRGVKPRWMVAALKKGKKMESFLIKGR
jgi:DNA-binding protein H-NS